jgi:DNA-binding CsgD family transcriptional regulator
MKTIRPKPQGFKPKPTRPNPPVACKNPSASILNPACRPRPKRLYWRIKRIRPLERLTQRESEVADLLAEGWDPGRAAGLLGISVERLRHHTRRIRRKLEIEGRTRISLWELGFGLPGRPPKPAKQG